MKSIYPVLLAVALLFTAGCKQREGENQRQPQTDVMSVETLSADSVPLIAAVGDSIAKTLLKTLKQELLSAIEVSGPVGAVEVCNVKALPLTETVARQAGMPVSVKRTSLKVRNPQNRPDSLELNVLRIFEQAKEAGSPLPPNVIQKIVQGDTVKFRYYKPLEIAPLCVNCHGEPEYLSRELKARLKTLYPEDRAVGYKVGDFRGVIRVEMVQPGAD